MGHILLNRSVSDRPKCSHPQKLQYRILWKLIRTENVLQKKTIRQAMNEYALSNLVEIIKRIIREHELKGCIEAKKLALTKNAFEVKINLVKVV